MTRNVDRQLEKHNLSKPNWQQERCRTQKERRKKNENEKIKIKNTIKNTHSRRNKFPWLQIQLNNL